MRTLAQGQWAWIRRPDYTANEVMHLTYCNVCAQDYPGHLDPLWANCVNLGVTKEQVLSKCHICHGVKSQPVFGHVTCLIRNDRVEIYRGRRFIGTVVQIGENEPVITLFSDSVDTVELTFNDLAIIQDNWNQCEEMLKKRLTSGTSVVK